MTTPPERDHMFDAVDEIKEQIRDTRRFSVLTGAMAILICLALGVGFGLWLGHTNQTANSTQQQVESNQTQAAKAKTQAQEKISALTKQQEETLAALKDFARCAQLSGNVGDCIGQKQVPGAQGRQGKEGRQGIPGKPATQAQVDAAVKKLCGESDCIGEQGPGPTPDQVLAAARQVCQESACGTDPAVLAAQVATAVANQIDDALKRYCDMHDDCEGPRGPKGEKGDEGAASTVPGPQGDPGVGYDCTGAPVPPGGTPATCPGQVVTQTETVTVPAPPADGATP